MAISSISLIMVKPASAQTAPTPSAPQFTLQLVGPPFILNTTYSLRTLILDKFEPNIGYTNQYSQLEIAVNNQQFDSNDGQYTIMLHMMGYLL